MRNSRKINRTFKRQSEQSDCGVACLLSVLRYHDSDSTTEFLREISGTNTVGTTMLGLCQAAEKLGFEAEGLKASKINDLKQLQNPCILHIRTPEMLEHYIVYYPTNDHTYLIGDPAKGVVILLEEELNNIWVSRSLLQMLPTELVQLKSAQINQKKNWLLNLLLDDYNTLIISTFLAVIASTLNLSTAFFYQKAVDKLLPNRDAKHLIAGIALLFVLLILRNAAVYIRGILLTNQGSQFNNRISSFFYKKLLFLPFTFLSNRRTGELIARLNDTRRIQQAISYLVGNITVNIFIAFSAIAYLYIISSVVGIFINCMTIIYFIVLAFYKEQIVLTQAETMHAYSINESNYIDTIQGAEAIKSNNKEHVFAKRTFKIQENFQSKVNFLGKISLKLSFIFDVTNTVLIVVALSLGAFLFLQNKIKLGEMLAIYTLTTILLPAITALASSIIQFQEAKVAFERMYEFASLQPENSIQNTMANDRYISNPSEIIISNLSFRFPGRKYIFREVSITIRKNEFNILIGESGQGKTTFLRIMQKLYNPSYGTISVDGTPWDSIDIQTWRSIVGVVPQEIKVFNSSVSNNISLEDNEEKEVIQFCETHGLDRYFAFLPQGYSTIVGEGGINLSGGQKQLLAIARALYKRPKILFLDEPTASMDSYTEDFVINLLHKIKCEMCILMITHRHHTVKHIDNIYTLVDGNITQSHAVPK